MSRTEPESETDDAAVARHSLPGTGDVGAGDVGRGGTIVASLFVGSLAVSTYHVWTHEAPLLATILGQLSLLALSLAFGLAGLHALSSVGTTVQRDIIGFRAGVAFALAGLASGGYALHQHLTPEAAVGLDVILFQATFVALVGGTVGLFAGLEKARRMRSVADLRATTRNLEAMQSEIRTEKQRFESLFQNAPTAIADVRYADGEPTIERANAAFESVADADVADLEGRNLFDVVPLAETATEDEMAAHVGNNEVYEAEVTVERAGEEGHFKLRVIPYEVGKAGERAFALYTDVTELRETQQELAASVAELEASNERLQRFAHAVSHDLQEPLRMVSSYLQLIRRRYRDDLDADAEEFIEFAVDGANRMRNMIDGLLEYSRVESEGDPFEPVDLERVFADVVEDLQFKIADTQARITADDLPTVAGDGNQIRQVLQNLVENAIEYSDDRPRVHVSAQHRDVKRATDGSSPVTDATRGSTTDREAIATSTTAGNPTDVDAHPESTADSEWIVSVADEGPGIDPDHQDRVFDVFQRLHPADDAGGTGIGLALCERIVERHGGDIWVESEPGEGTTFYFTLPAVDGEPG